MSLKASIVGLQVKQLKGALQYLAKIGKLQPHDRRVLMFLSLGLFHGFDFSSPYGTQELNYLLKLSQKRCVKSQQTRKLLHIYIVKHTLIQTCLLQRDPCCVFSIYLKHGS